MTFMTNGSTMGSFVDFRNVWLAYNDELQAQGQYAVEDIYLQVTEREFIAIVGPSGCGKSTFMKLTTGLKMPSKALLPWRTTVDNVLSPVEIRGPRRL